MRVQSLWAGVSLLALGFAAPAWAASDKVVIGDIDDMSGVYADVIGPKAVEAIKMAVADFGGQALGKPIDIVTFDHQNKPDLGAQKFREFADRDGATMILGGSNTGVSLAMAPVAKEKKVPFIAIGAAGASLTGKDCNAYTIHYSYDTTSLGNGTATAILKEGGKSLTVLPWSQYGFDGYGLSLFASDKFLTERPEVAKRLFGAYVKATQAAIADPAGAAAALKAMVPEIDEAVAEAQWKASIPLMVNEVSKADGMGKFNPALMKTTWEWVAKAQHFDAAKIDPTALIATGF